MKEPWDAYFDAGWREFVKSERQKSKVSNLRMFRVLGHVTEPGIIYRLREYIKTLKAKHSTLRLTRKPLGSPVTDRQFSETDKVWVNHGENAIGKYADYSIQIRPDRWIAFYKYLTVK